MAVTYITRDGMKIDGTTGQDHLLEVIYGHALTRMLLRPFLSPAVSDICGKFLSTRLSRRIIPSFVKKNHIDLGIYEKQEFDSYNAFFTRKIKADAALIKGIQEEIKIPTAIRKIISPFWLF